MKLTKNKIAFIKHNADKFTVLTALRAKTGEVPEVEPYTMEQVVNVIDAAPFFKNLGGQESATLNTVAHGEQDLILIHALSSSPDRTLHSHYIIYLTCERDVHYDLLRA